MSSDSERRSRRRKKRRAGGNGPGATNFPELVPLYVKLLILLISIVADLLH